jgi:small subunit ribosomal protein S4
MIGPKEKRERALGERLQLKGTRCNSPKCAMVRKPYRPGQHGKTGRRRNISDYGRQIQEKQKFKLTYGLDERNLRQVFERAVKRSGSTAANLVSLLESRIDNVVYRLGFAPSRLAARQLVLHGHIFVNGKRTRSPGYAVRVKDVVAIRPESREFASFRTLKESLKGTEVPAWLALDAAKLEGRVVGTPENPESPFEANLLVESFSK